MRIRRRGDILDPEVGVGIDDSEHRSTRVVSGGKIVTIITAVEPNLVRTANLRNRRDNGTGPGVDYDRGRLCATEEQMLVWSKGEPGRTAVADVEHCFDLARSR